MNVPVTVSGASAWNSRWRRMIQLLRAPSARAAVTNSCSRNERTTRSYDARRLGPGEQADHEDHDLEPGADDAHHDRDRDQRRDREDRVGGAHDHGVDDAAEHARDEAEDQADARRDERGREADRQRDAAGVEQARPQVATEPVGAEDVLGVGRRVLERVFVWFGSCHEKSGAKIASIATIARIVSPSSAPRWRMNRRRARRPALSLRRRLTATVTPATAAFDAIGYSIRIRGSARP